jgi:molybdopterin converting factor subunit 1
MPRFDNPQTGTVESADAVGSYVSRTAQESDMHIAVRLFALMREKAGAETIHLQLPESVSAAQALVALQDQYPILAPYLPRVRLALQMNFIDADTILHEGDELALIPPVSGGGECLK